eukprot:163674_1
MQKEVQPGNDYAKWTTAAKEMLKESATSSIHKYKKIIESIVNNECEGLNEEQSLYVLPETIIHRALEVLHSTIDHWKGLKLKRMKYRLETCLEYNRVAKDWYNQVKRKLLGNEFWIFAFQSIKHFTAKLG